MIRAVLVLALLAALAAAGPAAAAGLSSLVVDAGSGRTLQATAADAPRYPASLTKVMTLYLLFDEVARGRMTLATKLPVSPRAAAMPPTKLGLRAGSRISVRDAILALTTRSANDVAVVVAEGIAGSEAAFAARMTAKARALGMRQTTFRNASGLHHPQQRTTARDMATLARALLRDHPQYYRHFGARSFVYGRAEYQNHNRLLGSYRGADGIKTGFTTPSGYNLIASARRGDMRLIGVVLGAPSSEARNAMMTRLLDQGFRQASPPRMAKAEAAAKPTRPVALPTPRPRAYAGTAAPTPESPAVRGARSASPPG